MSRIGKKKIEIPQGVKVSLTGGVVEVEGPKGKNQKALPPMTSVKIEGNSIQVERADDSRQARMMHGLARSLIQGMVDGVLKGFRKDLEIVGVGYKAQLAGTKLTLNLGYSHPIVYNVPAGIKINVVEGTKLSIDGFDKQLVGEVAATIRKFKKPEPYKGKGVRYVGERITMKEGKTVGK
jgi:large subunit ribosomal protein L6